VLIPSQIQNPPKFPPPSPKGPGGDGGSREGNKKKKGLS